MRLAVLFGAGGLAALAAAVGGADVTSSSLCGQLSVASVTVTETLTAAPSTIYVGIQNQASQSADFASAASVMSAEWVFQSEAAPVNPTPGPSNEATVTSTISYTLTQTVPVSEAAQTSSSADAADTMSVFYYLLDNGTTSWLDGYTPAASGSVAVATTTFVVTPIPSLSTTTEFSTTTETSSTSVEASGNTTVFLTLTSFQTLTSTLTSTSSISSPVSPVNTSAVSSPLPSSSAVNSFVTSGLSITTSPVLATSSVVVPQGYGYINAAGYNASVVASVETSIATLTSTSTVSPTAAFVTITLSTNATAESPARPTTTGTADKRQVGAMVTATLSDGEVISFKNAWDGTAAVDLAMTSSSSSVPSIPSGESQASSVSTSAAATATSSSPVAYGAPLPTLISASLATPGAFSSSTAQAQGSSSSISLLSSASSAAPTFVDVATSTSTSLPSSFSSVAPTSSILASSSSLSTAVVSSTSQMGTTLMTITSSTTTTIASSTDLSSSPSATPLLCGDSGNFTMTFDDLPSFSPKNNSTASFPPIFNPYNHLYFSDGFAYAPPPTDPFVPHSPPHLAIYVPEQVNSSMISGSPDSGFVSQGEFGAGPNEGASAYWFDVYSGWFGCDTSSDPEDVCELAFTGRHYHLDTDTEDSSVQFNAYPVACADNANCPLSYFDFGGIFKNISGFSVTATLGNETNIKWFMDDVQMAWSNNSCAAGLERISAP